MPKKFECYLTTEELQKIYDEVGTIKAMCPIVGCKSNITMAKILHEHNIDTNKNAMTRRNTMLGLNDEEFKAFLENEYKTKSMTMIGKELGITWVIVGRLFDKYGIERTRSPRAKSIAAMEANHTNPRKRADGYIHEYAPWHPKASSTGYIRQHVLIAEAKIGRFLKEDEVVHHIDRDKTNNSPDNLLVLTKQEHAHLHSEDTHKWRRR